MSLFNYTCSQLRFSTGQALANSIMFNQLFTSDTFDLSRNSAKTLQVAAGYLRPVAKTPQNVTGRSRIPSTCHEIASKRYRSRRNTPDLSRNPAKTLQVAARYPRPVTKTPQNVTGRSKIPPTCHEIPPKRYRSQQDTPDLSQKRRKTLQVAVSYPRPVTKTPQNVTGRSGVGTEKHHEICRQGRIITIFVPASRHRLGCIGA